MQIPPPSHPAPETLNEIVSSPAAAFASVIACRSEPGPESEVFVTVNVAPYDAAETRNRSAVVRASLVLKVRRHEFH